MVIISVEMFSRFASAPLAQGLFPRVRRNIMEGIQEEMVDTLEKNAAGNETDSRFKRQVENQDIQEQDNTNASDTLDLRAIGH